ncbi:hypothetical protein HOO68_04365 [Candidatus Gracilibacteria bacterium]|nr:hypothetical protein [Candidatus Gracilibacteria bacterium]
MLVSATSSKVPIKILNTSIDSNGRIDTLKGILYSNAMPFNYSRLSVVIDGFQKEPRGRMRNAQISLSPYIARDMEFTKLFVHELAHYIDIYVFFSNGLRADISDDFYHISWQSPTAKRSQQGTMDFVSGYAATNQYEDFAESFVFYVFHNDTFADRALRSESLRQKYLFFSNSIFSRGNFQGTDFSIGIVPSYVWDSTKVSISLQKYLYSL